MEPRIIAEVLIDGFHKNWEGFLRTGERSYFNRCEAYKDILEKFQEQLPHPTFQSALDHIVELAKEIK